MARCLFTIVAITSFLRGAALAQDAVVIFCTVDACNYTQAYSPTLNGRNTVQVQPAPLSPGVSARGRTHNERLARLPGFYRDPASGQLRVLNGDGTLGDLVNPPKAKSGSAAWTIEYRKKRSEKTAISMPGEQFVAFIRAPHIEARLVGWLKLEVRAAVPHPRRQQIITGALAFAGESEEMRAWRDELRATMQGNLDLFRTEAVDPSRLEATLADGVAAMRVYQLISPGKANDSLQKEVSGEYDKLLARFAIAGAFKNAGVHDAFLAKLAQIGLARWSRPPLVDGLEKVLQASAQQHYERALALSQAGQHAEAFDEARIAAGRAPCNEEIGGFYYQSRVEFVHNTMVPSPRQYDPARLTMLQQIVRELQSLSQDATPSPERIQHMHRRIAEGERLDKSYLPLQLKKAQFLAKIGELTASREVVTDVERHAKLGRTEADEWLDMDATLNGNILTLRQTLEKRVDDQIANGLFKEALETAALGLKAEPENPKFLYWGAVAAAVLRDTDKTRQFVQRYLRPLASGCGDTASGAERTLLELYTRKVQDLARSSGSPNWMSGVRYTPGEAYYDPLSGSFNPRILTSTTDGKDRVTASVFRWEGFLAASITTTVGPRFGVPEPLVELEPAYNQPHVYMTGIGMRANSEGRRNVNVLRYLNSPEFDPVLAAKFTPRVILRTWAGNPFFHPFIWNDIFLFDLSYDDLGRIKEAIPVTIDASRPVSSFSERLTFVWEGDSKRLLAIKGAKYLRELFYDKLGRLKSEKITHPSGRGKIEYTYRGDSPEIAGITCEDNFFDRARRSVIVQPPSR